MSKQAERGPRIGIATGSDSDLKVMRHVGRSLEKVGLEEGVDFEWGVKSVHRTLSRAVDYARGAREKGLEILIGGAGASAHLPGILASETTLPVLGVAITSSPDVMNRALGSMIGMPEGKPLATFQAEAGAFNAGLFAARILSIHDLELAEAYSAYEASLETHVIGTDERLHELGAKAYLEAQAAEAREAAGGGYYFPGGQQT